MIPIYVLDHETRKETVFLENELSLGSISTIRARLVRFAIKAVIDSTLEPLDDLLRRRLQTRVQAYVNLGVISRELVQGKATCDLPNNHKMMLERNQVALTVTVTEVGWKPTYSFSVSTGSLLTT